MKAIPKYFCLLLLFCACSFASTISVAQFDPPKLPALRIVLVSPETATPAAVAQWKSDGFKGVAVVLDEQHNPLEYERIDRCAADGGLSLYYWIEVARNPEMAKAHPRWMAALGMHHDWLARFPKAAEPGLGEVAKAYPWVPLAYRETFEAHLRRIEQLLKRAPGNWRGLLLNDIQAGPSSCGCGNLQCRWAIDYQAPSTASPIHEDDVAAKFVTEIRKRTGDKLVIPVWTTECEEVDLPADKHQGRPGTGMCGTVGCATGACPKVFTRQWSAVADASDGPIALLALPAAFERTRKEFGGGVTWVSNVVTYVNQTLPANGGKPFPPERLWAVVQGAGEDEEKAAQSSAAQSGVQTVVVVRTKLDQTYEPRIIRVN